MDIEEEEMKKAMINYIKREKFDDLYTPDYAVIPLLKYIPKGITIWECCDFTDEEGGESNNKVIETTWL